MRRTLLAAVTICLAILALAGLAFYLYGRPSVLRVAVVTGSVDQDLMRDASRILAKERAAIRFAVVPVNDASAVTKAMDAGAVDLGIVSSDQPLPETAKTVVVMRKNALFLMAASDAGITTIADLKGKTIGLVEESMSGTGYAHMLESILARQDLAVNAVTMTPVSVTNAAAMLREKSLAAVFVAGVPGDGPVADSVHAVASAGAGEPVFIPIGHTVILAQNSIGYEQMTISAGTFSGAIARPAQDLETIAVTVRLFASTTLRDTLIGALARAMFSVKPKLAGAYPVALRIQAPSTSKDATLPVHPGAAAYLDGEEESFFDRFSELFYLGAMVLSVIGSAVAAMASHLSSGSKREYRAYVTRLLEILRLARLTNDPAMLRLLQLEADNIFADFMAAASAQKHDEQRVSTLGLIIGQVHQALADSRSGTAGAAQRIQKSDSPELRSAS